MPSVSVLLNTYNYGHWRSQAIGSVLQQTRLPDEIIVVDDGSTDDTRSVVEKFGSKVRYVYQENKGQAQAILRGIAESTGDVLCLLDADDSFRQDKLLAIEDCFKRESAGAIYNAYNIVNSDGGTLATNQPKRFSTVNLHRKALFRRAGGVPTSCISIKASIARALQYPPDTFRICADSYLLQVLPLLTKVHYISQPLTRYVVHGNNRFISRDALERTRILAELERVARHAVKEYYGIELYHSLYEMKDAGLRRDFRRAWQEYFKAIQYVMVHWPGGWIGVKEIAKAHLFLAQALDGKS